MAFMYILECADGRYYVGSTRNIHGRVAQHQRGEGSVFTAARLPVELVYVAEFENVGEAFAFEKKVQGWSRAKREALIRGDFDALPGLSRSSYRRKTG